VTAETRRPLGYGLLAGAAGISLLMLIWLATSGAEAGGIVLGLLLVFVLAGPLAGAGWYVLARAGPEAAEERAFVGKRRVLDADRRFRREVASQLRQLVELPELPAAPLTRMAESLERGGQDDLAWYDTVQLDDAQAAVLAQYDDLVRERVRWLRDHAGQGGAPIGEAVKDLEQALDQRTDLLVRGRHAPSVAPAVLLGATEPAADAAGLQALEVGDAVTHEGIDFVVEGVATAFSDGQTWKLAHLVPSSSEAAEHWLSVAPGGLEIAWLDSLAPPLTGAGQLVVDGHSLPLEGTRTATVRVTSKAGSADGELVTTWSYRSGAELGLVEQWPDDSVHAYGGRIMKPGALDVWPAART
jgi:uncharacterized protein DUF4178